MSGKVIDFNVRKGKSSRYSFPWFDHDYGNLDDIVEYVLKPNNIHPQFHPAAYPVFDKLLTNQVPLIVVNLQLPPGDIPLLDTEMRDLAATQTEYWKIGLYFIRRLHRTDSANSATPIFATGYQSKLWDPQTKANYSPEIKAQLAGATAYYSLITQQRSLEAAILQQFGLRR